MEMNVKEDRWVYSQAAPRSENLVHKQRKGSSMGWRYIKVDAVIILFFEHAKSKTLNTSPKETTRKKGGGW